MSTALTTLARKLAQRFDMGDTPELLDTLKATAIKGQVSDAQMTALMIVSNQYGLNPWTKEIYAFLSSASMAGAASSMNIRNLTGWSSIRTQKPVPASSTAKTAPSRSR